MFDLDDYKKTDIGIDKIKEKNVKIINEINGQDFSKLWNNETYNKNFGPIGFFGLYILI